MQIRAAAPGESAEIAAILNAAYLQTDTESIEQAVRSGNVLIAERPENERSGAPESTETAPMLGALVLDGSEITAIAVRPGRRGQGIGRRLVTAARQRLGRVVAEFDPTVRPFWEAVGFEVSVLPGSDRLHGEY